MDNVVWVVTWYTELGDDNLRVFDNQRKATDAIFISAKKAIAKLEDEYVRDQLADQLRQNFEHAITPHAVIEWWQDELGHRTGLWCDVYEAKVE